MTRKEYQISKGKAVVYVIDDEINVSEIISELSSAGCKGGDLGAAYRKLISDNPDYEYTNEATGDKIVVIDKNHIADVLFSSAHLPWFYLMSLFVGVRDMHNLVNGFVEELAKKE